MSEAEYSGIEEIVRMAEERVLLLLTDGFSDDPILPLIIKLRKASKSVQLVGFSKREIRSAQGILIQPDTTLDELNQVAPGTMLIIPDGRQINSRITTDPRAHNLVETILSRNAIVVTVPWVAYTLRQILPIEDDLLITWQ